MTSQTGAPSGVWRMLLGTSLCNVIVILDVTAVDAVQLRRYDQTVEKRGSLAAAVRAGDRVGQSQFLVAGTEMSPLLTSLSPIETARLRLRPLKAGDAEAFRAMTDEPAILDAIHFLDQPFTAARAEQLLVGEDDGYDCFWGAYLMGRPALLGTVGTHLRGAEEIEVGYWFAKQARGRGLAAEAVAGVVSTLSLAYLRRRVVAECRPENVASWRLLERVGFRDEGLSGERPGRRRLVFSTRPVA